MNIFEAVSKGSVEDFQKIVSSNPELYINCCMWSSDSHVIKDKHGTIIDVEHYYLEKCYNAKHILFHVLDYNNVEMLKILLKNGLSPNDKIIYNSESIHLNDRYMLPLKYYLQSKQYLSDLPKIKEITQVFIDNGTNFTNEIIVDFMKQIIRRYSSDGIIIIMQEILPIFFIYGNTEITTEIRECVLNHAHDSILLAFDQIVTESIEKRNILNLTKCAEE